MLQVAATVGTSDKVYTVPKGQYENVDKPSSGKVQTAADYRQMDANDIHGSDDYEEMDPAGVNMPTNSRPSGPANGSAGADYRLSGVGAAGDDDYEQIDEARRDSFAGFDGPRNDSFSGFDGADAAPPVPKKTTSQCALVCTQK